MVLAVDELGDLAGVLAPEDWADPKKFYDALARTGRSTLEDTVEAIVTVGPG